MDVGDAAAVAGRVLDAVSEVYVGKRGVLEVIVATLFSEGHVILEGPPGTGKTLLAKALAAAVGGSYGRIQGNPDLLPSDITGFHVYTIEGEARLVRGPIFNNVVLFDEINRSPPRTHSALLEALQERQATIDGVTYRLPRPFMVIATHIPERLGAGVYPLDFALLDRFSAKLRVDYSPADEEGEIIAKSDYIEAVPVKPAAPPGEVVEAIEVMKRVHVSGRVLEYITSLTAYLRNHEAVEAGPSHRASVSLYKASRALAALRGRDYVIPDDVKQLAPAMYPHRLIVKAEYEAEGLTPDKLVEEALNNVPVPKE